MASLYLVPRGEADFDLFPYNPSAGAGYAFLVMFGITAVIHVILMIMYRSWYFIPFILGCIGEAAGYYGRAWAHDNIRNGTPYLIQMMLILGSAPLLAATVYMTLGRLARNLDAANYCIIRSTWVSKIYILIDVASFGCQMAGSAAQASGEEGAKQGIFIVKIGLGIQLAAFGLFLLMAVVLHMRLNSGPTAVSERPQVRWRKHMWTLYAVSFLIIARSLFRLIEFAQGPDGEILKSEWMMYAFDATLLLTSTVVFAVVHPGRLFRYIRKADGTAWSSLDDGNVPLNPYKKESSS
ncbi:putative RTA1 domain protein [Boeremia exigua]|uniref:putative RTA1 domain protein n=1 Tax=Boeremia exigua TaxID=749465 RepID=UPI001E8D9611|nr:putative RTA1 domain protein [Boeremia exigua]KAH6625098.1 putative RTA1 domain protein [Boeremia exigua]